ncbi:hypothetical protein FRC02_001342 [Tulasnella sp. 418]|nr:hypothetical protein FRC02_001342 [Tulasnella sp. 418]
MADPTLAIVTFGVALEVGRSALLTSPATTPSLIYRSKHPFPFPPATHTPKSCVQPIKQPNQAFLQKVRRRRLKNHLAFAQQIILLRFHFSPQESIRIPSTKMVHQINRTHIMSQDFSVFILYLHLSSPKYNYFYYDSLL